MPGATSILFEKGAIIESTWGAVTKYRFCKIGTTSVQHIAPIAASTDITLGVVQDAVDSAKVATGKATVNVRMGGISKVEAGAAVTAGAEVMSDTSGRAIAWTATNRMVGRALTGASAAGDWIDVELAITPRIAQ